MNYYITNIAHAKYKKSILINNLNIGVVFILNNVKYRIIAIGVKLKQQPVTKEYYFDLVKDYITCLRLTDKKDNINLESFSYLKQI